MDFDETWPNVTKYVFLYFDIGLYAWKILVFELNPFKQWRTIKIPKILVFKVSYE